MSKFTIGEPVRLTVAFKDDPDELKQLVGKTGVVVRCGFEWACVHIEQSVVFVRPSQLNSLQPPIDETAVKVAREHLNSLGMMGQVKATVLPL